MEKLLTFNEVLKILRVHYNTLYGYLNSGLLKGFRLGGDGHWRVKESDLNEFMRSRTKATGHQFTPKNLSSPK